MAESLKVLLLSKKISMVGGHRFNHSFYAGEVVAAHQQIQILLPINGF